MNAGGLSRDFQVVELPAGQRTRYAVDLERPWSCCTVVYIPYSVNSIRESAFDSGPNLLLHLQQGDAGIPIRQVGQRIRAEFGTRIWWTSRYNYGLTYHKILLLFSDAVGVDFSSTDRQGYWKADSPGETYTRHLATADNNDPTNVGAVIRGAAAFVNDGGTWRALTPADLGGGGAAGPENIVGGDTATLAASAFETIVDPGSGFAVRVFRLLVTGNSSTGPRVVARVGGATEIAAMEMAGPPGVALIQEPAGILVGGDGDVLEIGHTSSSQVLHYSCTYTLEAV